MNIAYKVGETFAACCDNIVIFITYTPRPLPPPSLRSRRQTISVAFNSFFTNIATAGATDVIATGVDVTTSATETAVAVAASAAKEGRGCRAT